jgi:hypothetical protein
MFPSNIKDNTTLVWPIDRNQIAANSNDSAPTISHGPTPTNSPTSSNTTARVVVQPQEIQEHKRTQISRRSRGRQHTKVHLSSAGRERGERRGAVPSRRRGLERRRLRQAAARSGRRRRACEGSIRKRDTELIYWRLGLGGVWFGCLGSYKWAEPSGQRQWASF